MNVAKSPEQITKAHARSLWMRAQKLDQDEPFGHGARATKTAIEHLGYVQIDTINVIERSHHHILYNRIPRYRRQDLHHAQSKDKSVFEYWTHALSYVPTKDLPFFMGAMRRRTRQPGQWLASVEPSEVRRVVAMIKREGPLSIRDIDDDVAIEKTHAWGSRKPSHKALQRGFYSGRLVISERLGMLKKYEIAERHFGWEDSSAKPLPASESAVLGYLIDRGLRSQGVISLDSIAHLDSKKKPALLKLIEKRVKNRELLEVTVEGYSKCRHWLKGLDFEPSSKIDSEKVHILSPFDPLTIQRKRLKHFFDYQHRFEAYLPKGKRVFGYFALPVLLGDKVVAAVDVKTDRIGKKLLLQKWSWIPPFRSPSIKRLVEAELHRFEAFQLGI